MNLKNMKITRFMRQPPIALVCFVISVIYPDLARGQFYSRQYAVVIGINEYVNKEWPQLSYARKDAEGVANLMKRLGLTVLALYDAQATKSNIIALLEDRLAPIVKQEDLVLFFFAGHGTTKRLGQKDWGYIIPTDASDKSSSFISMDELVTLSQKMGNAKHQAFVMDCCYGGLLGLRNVKISTSVPDYLQQVSTRAARQILTAGGKNQQVLDGGPFGHSLFTGYFIKGIQEGDADLNSDGWITFNELVSYIQPAATRPTQTPGYANLPGHEQGEVVFRSLMGSIGAESQSTQPTNEPVEKGQITPFRSSSSGALRNTRFKLNISKFSADSPIEASFNSFRLALEDAIKKQGGETAEKKDIADITINIVVSMYVIKKIGQSYRTQMDFEHEIYSNIENRRID